MSAPSSRPDPASPDLWWRVGVVLAAAITVALGAPAWVTTPLSAVAALAAVQSVVRHRRRGWPDAVVVGTAGLLVALVLVGLVLQLVPAGLARVPWAIGGGVLAMLAVLWGARGATPTEARVSFDRRTLLQASWYLGGAALTVLALVVSVHAANVTDRPPLQLSTVGTAGTVLVQAGDDGGRYELVARPTGGAASTIGPFEVADGHSARYRVALAARGTTSVSLRRADSGRTLRSLVLDASGAAVGSGTTG